MKIYLLAQLPKQRFCGLKIRPSLAKFNGWPTGSRKPTIAVWHGLQLMADGMLVQSSTQLTVSLLLLILYFRWKFITYCCRCSSCVTSEWGCSWCAYTGTCNPSPTCDEQLVIEQSQCPNVTGFNFERYIPTGQSKVFFLRTSFLPGVGTVLVFIDFMRLFLAAKFWCWLLSNSKTTVLIKRFRCSYH